ncbi:MAG: M56 family metallopeptidase, partial [Planctomycetota bacterium]
LDPAVNVLPLVVRSLLWFHPLVWWANGCLGREREKCCDEVAIATLDSTPRRYSMAILDSLLRQSPGKGAEPSLAVVGPARNIEDRIRTVMSRRGRFHRRANRLAWLASILLAALVLPISPLLIAQQAGDHGRSPDAESSGASQATERAEHARPASGVLAEYLQSTKDQQLQRLALQYRLGSAEQRLQQPADLTERELATVRRQRAQARTKLTSLQQQMIQRRRAGQEATAEKPRGHRSMLVDAQAQLRLRNAVVAEAEASGKPSAKELEQRETWRKRVRELGIQVSHLQRQLARWRDLSPEELRYVPSDPRLAIWRRALYYMPPSQDGRRASWASGFAEVRPPDPNSGVTHSAATILTFSYEPWDVCMAVDASRPGLAGPDLVRLNFSGKCAFDPNEGIGLVTESAMIANSTRWEYGPADIAVSVDGQRLPLRVRGVYSRTHSDRWPQGLLRYAGIEAYLAAEGLCRIGEDHYPVRIVDSSRNRTLGDVPDVPRGRQPVDPYFSGDTLLVDLSSGGDFTDPEQMVRVWYGQPFELDGKVWQIELTRNGRSLTARQLKPDEYGRVRIPDAKQWYGVLVGKKYVLNVAPDGNTAVVPADTYRIYEMGVISADAGEDAQPRRWRVVGGEHTVAAGQMTELQPHAPRPGW